MSSQYSSRFWDKYIDKTISYGVRPHQSRWYVRHAEGYFKVHSGCAQKRHDAEFVTAYLEQKGRDKRLEAWQFRQRCRTKTSPLSSITLSINAR